MTQTKEKVKKGVVLSLLLSLFSGLAVFSVTTALWEAKHWDNLKIDEVINELKTPVEGTGSQIMSEFLGRCLIPSVIIVLAVFVLAMLLRKRRRFRPAAIVCTLVTAAVTLAVIVYAALMLEVPQYIRDMNSESTYIEDNYVDPADVELGFPEQKRNLIFIWLESVESTFADKENGGAFDKNVIAELTELAEENVSFTGGGGVNGACSMAGSTWTTGALFANTTGLPLKIPITDSSMSSQETFFPGVVGLGDILSDEGYQQALLLGSNATFGGLRLLFTEHGNYTVYDYPYSLEKGEIPPDYNVWWGYEDEKLFAFAREHITEMAASGQPFNFAMETTDTHFPDGYVCRLCDDRFGEDRYSNVMACSGRQVREFVQWIQAQPFYENTTIIISGDHITMDVVYCDNVPQDYQRRVFTTVINPAPGLSDSDRFREYSAFDIFPTTLAAMGVDIPGDRLGLGVNLFSGKATLLERDGFERMNSMLKKHSAFTDALSGIDEAVFALSKELGNTDAAPVMVQDGDKLLFTLHNLDAFADEVTKFEVFAENVDGDTRTTLWLCQAYPDGNGGYTADVPPEKAAVTDSFTLNIYASTSSGRIKVDGSYACDLNAGTLVRIK